MYQNECTSRHIRVKLQNTEHTGETYILLERKFRKELRILAFFSSAVIGGRRQELIPSECWGKITFSLEFLYPAKLSFKRKAKNTNNLRYPKSKTIPPVTFTERMSEDWIG